MSTERPRMDIVPNAPELITQLDAIATDGPDEPDVAPDDEEDDVPESKSYRRGKKTAPPSSSRDLGGRCPRCGSYMETRFRAVYDDADTAAIVLYADCSGACGLTLESENAVEFDMMEPQY